MLGLNAGEEVRHPRGALGLVKQREECMCMAQLGVGCESHWGRVPTPHILFMGTHPS
jgi:hypothetical protein